MRSLHSTFLLAVLVWSCPAVRAAEPPITAIAFSPDGKQVVGGSQSGITVRSWPELKMVRKLETKLEQVHDLKFSPDGKRLLAAGGIPGEEGKVEVFSWERAKPQAVIGNHEDLVYSVAWRADSMGWATASLDRSVAVFEAAKPKPVKVITGHSRGVKAVAILPDGKTLITGGIDNSLRVWSLPEGKPIRTFNNHTRPIHDVAVRPQPPLKPPLSKGGKQRGLPMLASVSDDRTIRLWQPTIGRMVRFARLKQAVPLAVRWTPDGSRIVVACSDGRVRVMDPDTAEITHNLSAVKGWAYCLAVHPNGKEVAVGGSGGELVRMELKKP